MQSRNLLDFTSNLLFVCSLSLPPYVPQQLLTLTYLFLFPVCNGLVDIVFLMDVSSSIIWSEPANWQLMKDFVDHITQAFPISLTQTRLAIVRFSDSASVEFILNRYTNNRDVSRAI